MDIRKYTVPHRYGFKDSTTLDGESNLEDEDEESLVIPLKRNTVAASIAQVVRFTREDNNCFILHGFNVSIIKLVAFVLEIIELTPTKVKLLLDDYTSGAPLKLHYLNDDPDIVSFEEIFKSQPIIIDDVDSGCNENSFFKISFSSTTSPGDENNSSLEKNRTSESSNSTENKCLQGALGCDNNEKTEDYDFMKSFVYDISSDEENIYDDVDDDDSDEVVELWSTEYRQKNKKIKIVETSLSSSASSHSLKLHNGRKNQKNNCAISSEIEEDKFYSRSTPEHLISYANTCNATSSNVGNKSGGQKHPIILDYMKLKIGDYIRCSGYPEHTSSGVILHAQTFELVDDPNEVTSHTLEVIRDSMLLSQKRSQYFPDSEMIFKNQMEEVKEDKALQSEEQDYVEQKEQQWRQQQQRQQETSSLIDRTQSISSGRIAQCEQNIIQDQSNDLDANDLIVLSHLKQSLSDLDTNTSQGLHISHIIQHFKQQFTEDEVKRSLENLTNEGLCWAGESEDLWKADY